MNMIEVVSVPRRLVLVALLLCSAVSAVRSQTPNGRALPADPAAQAEVLIGTQLHDTSTIQRGVALHLLQRSSLVVRRAAIPLIQAALRDTSSVIRGRALGAVARLGVEAKPLMPAVTALATDPRERNREYAIELVATLGTGSSAERVALSVAADDPDEDVRLAAGAAFRRIGDHAAAISVFRRSLSSNYVENRLWVARALADLNDSTAVPVLQAILRDTSFRRRTQAAIGLGALGPKARAAVGDLTRMLEDTTPRRIPQGRAWVLESGAPYAAWALSQIIQFRSAYSNTVLDPLHVRVVDGSYALKSDGLGVYAWGVDSVAVFRGSGFFFMLSALGDGRGPIGPTDSSFRRSLAFDLSSPVQASGARPRGTVTDNEAYIWIWYKRDPATDQVTTFRELPVSDRPHSIERVEMHFRINGVLHELQMGPFVEGQGGATQWYTGVHGDGTSLAEIIHPAREQWIVRASSGSVARLWSFENRARPVDRGLYNFSFELQFHGMPGGATGNCIPYPTTCHRQ
jgi:HEAT repeat protein